MEDVLAAIERGRSEGGSVAAGGSRADADAYLVAPTVFEDVADDAMLSCEEVFGPVTSLYRFGTLDEAIERANAVEFGLSAALFTSSLPATQQFVESAEAGILHVNSQTAGADVHVPFGGVKGSASGRTSRAARRGSSTPRSSPCTRIRSRAARAPGSRAGRARSASARARRRGRPTAGRAPPSRP